MKYYRLSGSQLDIANTELLIKTTVQDKTLMIGGGYYDEGHFDVEAIKKAYLEVIRRNDSLRLRVLRRHGTFMQYIKGYSDPIISYHTLKDGQAEFEQLCKHPNPPALSFLDEDLCRAEIYTCADGTGGIILWQQHICTDGHSLDMIIYPQLCEFYVAYKNGEEPKPAKKLFSFIDSLERRKTNLKKHGLKDFFSWGWDCAKNIFRYSIPIKSSLQEKEQVKLYFELSGEVHRQFVELCKKLQCSTMNVFMAIAAIVTTKVYGKKNFQYSILTNGRATYALKNTTGYLAQNIPVFMNVHRNQTAAELIRTTYMRFLKSSSRNYFSFKFRHFTFDSLLKFSSGCIFRDVIWFQFNYLKSIPDKDAPLKQYMIDQIWDNLNIYLEITDEEYGIKILFEYTPSVLNPNIAKRAISLYKQVLNIVLDDPNQPIDIILNRIS